MNKRRIAYVSFHENVTGISVHFRQGVQIGRIGQLVEVDYIVHAFADNMTDDSGTNEPCAACNENFYGLAPAAWVNEEFIRVAC